MNSATGISIWGDQEFLSSLEPGDRCTANVSSTSASIRIKPRYGQGSKYKHSSPNVFLVGEGIKWNFSEGLTFFRHTQPIINTAFISVASATSRNASQIGRRSTITPISFETHTMNRGGRDKTADQYYEHPTKTMPLTLVCLSEEESKEEGEEAQGKEDDVGRSRRAGRPFKSGRSGS
jgi:hypothetical protein